MNEGFTSHRPPDEEPDPLLEALRQRLGTGYGQEPSPELWAGIQQQLPAAAPRPWWLRARRLLPLLAGLLLVSLVLVRQAARNPLASHTARSAPANQSRPTTSANQPRPTASARFTPAASGQLSTEASAPASTSPDAPAGQAAALGAATSAGVASLGRTVHNRAAGAPGAATSPAGRWRRYSQLVATEPKAPALVITSPPTTTTRRTGSLLPTARDRRRQVATRKPGRDSLAARNLLPLAAGRPTSRLKARTKATASLPRHSALISSTGLSLATTQPTGRRAATHPLASDLPLAGAAQDYAAAIARRQKGHTRPSQGSSDPGITRQEPDDELLVLTTKTDTLALRRAGLLLPANRLPAPLTARPDSFAPHLAPVRRWALLAVVGPTLSYRTLPASTLAYSSTSLATAPSSNGVRPSISFADQERPAAGLGAQVQARRVLSGRWALALGLGYQEYATRPSQQGSPQATYYYSPSSPTGIDTTKSASNLRDTYRFLTLPVQLSYALGPPRGRVALGLLGGLEPGWYLGGRSAETSSCHCQQQSFTSASTSPYNAFTVALSLGLDVRYRLGGGASRWQVVLQPTGRYVATPFVRNASLYARRQPYSLGLLSGVAWAF